MLSEQIGALCTDFYINQKMSLKLDLPTARETVLDMFDRVRRDQPRMERFRRYDDELALESPEEAGRYAWLALGRTAIRSGSVNPEVMEDAYGLHRLILELAPYFLSISPLDMDCLELMYGIDLEAIATATRSSSTPCWPGRRCVTSSPVTNRWWTCSRSSGWPWNRAAAGRRSSRSRPGPALPRSPRAASITSRSAST